MFFNPEQTRIGFELLAMACRSEAARLRAEAQLHEIRIRQTAYQLWEDAGKPEGKSEEFWFQAKAIVK